MWLHNDRPFKGVDKLSAAAEFIFAAERLIAREVTPELLPETERAAIEYYLECLSKQFWDSKACADRPPSSPACGRARS